MITRRHQVLEPQVGQDGLGTAAFRVVQDGGDVFPNGFTMSRQAWAIFRRGIPVTREQQEWVANVLESRDLMIDGPIHASLDRILVLLELPPRTDWAYKAECEKPIPGRQESECQVRVQAGRVSWQVGVRIVPQSDADARRITDATEQAERFVRQQVVEHGWVPRTDNESLTAVL